MRKLEKLEKWVARQEASDHDFQDDSRTFVPSIIIVACTIVLVTAASPITLILTPLALLSIITDVQGC